MSKVHTHFPILHKEYIERDEYAEVEDINAVFHSHLLTKKKKIVRLTSSKMGVSVFV